MFRSLESYCHPLRLNLVNIIKIENVYGRKDVLLITSWMFIILKYQILKSYPNKQRFFFPFLWVLEAHCWSAIILAHPGLILGLFSSVLQVTSLGCISLLLNRDCQQSITAFVMSSVWVTPIGWNIEKSWQSLFSWGLGDLGIGRWGVVFTTYWLQNV